MSAKHRKASKLAAKRTAVAATAVGATAAVGLMSAPAQAAAPDYSKAISDYSHALDNFLNASNNVTNSVGSVWNPIASPTGGILPTFGSSYTKVDVTKISSLPAVLRNIAGLNLPTGVPGVVPNVVLPGGSQLDLSKILPTSMPGGTLLNGAATVLDGALGLPVIGPYISDLPALSEIVDGLTATQSKYTSSYAWKLLQLSGTTNVLNTFVQTPSGLAIKKFILPNPIPGLPDIPLGPLEILPEGSLPSGTVWLPQADGTYTFPLGAKAGFWGAAPTAALKIPGWLGGSETVVSVPIGAAGVELPLGLAKAGVLSGSVLLPTQNGVYSPIGLTMTNVNTILPVGFTNINVTTGNYVGTNGINVNNGQNLLLLQNPLGVPLPILYGLGGFNFGVEGAGLTSPSLFGIKLFSDNLLQVGSQTGPNSSAGLIPPNILPTDPLSQIITGVTSPLGVSSLTQLLGIDAFVKPVMTAFGPVYQAISAVTLKPLSDFATSQYGPFINGSASQLLDLSKTLSEQSANLPGAPAQSAADANAAATQTGAHRAENGGTLVSTLLARNTGVEQVQPTADTGRPASTDTPDAGSGTTAPPVTPAPAPVIETPTQTADPTPPAETPTTETPTVETPAVEAPAEEPTTSPEAAETTTPAETAPSATETSTSTDSGTTDTGSTDTGADKAA
ncbi:hypothetical protein HWD35_12875 [Tsukamurella tyrosinosolvens]|uniref:hypothetical protein n=1 Tax=Tsukamurella tyrosinosolvens TaxID=57704 RepID=UPI0007924078|nr:hypothetical protein [Tsukamurella tyrosinosolvens]KXP04521.1 hypothetical protein AXK59_14030 [Tsukamurella tyrosinosolvens]KZL97775.1 hypothetical protein AXX05_02230 [Tsukamurella tyrosinosolvens]MCA4995604.1 hypothetical protein [Tsukamurella tyrosinosolvens]